MDYNALFQSQKNFFETHRSKNIDFRKEQLTKLKTILKANEHLLYEAVYADFKKSKFDTFLNELSQIYREIDFFVKNLPKLSKRQKVVASVTILPGKSYIQPEPLGVTLVIGAWNYPFYLSLMPVVSALAAGNTCILKPSELAAHSASTIATLLNTNFPAEYLYVVEGGIPETTALLQLRWNKIFFTGSPQVGKIVYEAAAKNLIPVTLELGGKSPTIVTPSANLDVAAKRILWGKFLNAGQTCIAPDYVVVHSSIKDQFVKSLCATLEESAYLDGSAHYTAIIQQKHFDRLIALMEGCTVVLGGQYNAQTRYIQPTILDQVKWEDRIMQEEIFGPLLPLLTYDNYDDLLHIIRGREKPLAAYLFSDDEAEKSKFREHLSFGGGCINDVLMHIVPNNLPFGGVGNSGIGSYHGAYGFAAFSHQKPIVEKATWGEPNWKYPPYDTKKLSWMKRILKL